MIQNLSNLPLLTQLSLNGNILMLIPDEIVQKFADNPEIKLFNEQKNHKCTFQLAKLYQAIMIQMPESKLIEMFSLLEEKGQTTHFANDEDEKPKYRRDESV